MPLGGMETSRNALSTLQPLLIALALALLSSIVCFVVLFAVPGLSLLLFPAYLLAQTPTFYLRSLPVKTDL